jgi:hypothetical protein
MRKRKYQEDFMKSGFTSVVINGDEMLQRVSAMENEAFNVNKLMGHLETKHGSLGDCHEIF